MIVVMMMSTFALFVMIMVMMMSTFALFVVIMVMMLMMMLVSLCLKLCKSVLESILALHCLKDLSARKLVYGSRDDNGILIMLS